MALPACLLARLRRFTGTGLPYTQRKFSPPPTWSSLGTDHSNPIPVLPRRLAVEAFDPRLNAWVPKAPMQQARAYGAAAFAEGALWVIGGMQADGYQYNRTFER